VDHPIPTSEETSSRGWLASPAHLPYAAGFGPLLHQDEIVMAEPMPENSILQSSMKNAKALPSIVVLPPPRRKRQQFLVDVKAEVQAEIEAMPVKSAQLLDDFTDVLSSLGEGVANESPEKGLEDETGMVTAHSFDSLSNDDFPIKGLGDPRLRRKSQLRPGLKRSKASLQKLCPECALSPKGRVVVTLKKKTMLSADSILFEFALPQPNQVLGLPVGQHVLLAAHVGGDRSRIMLRPYTPVSSDHDDGCVQFVIKICRPTAFYPFGGKMSQYLDRMNIDDRIEIRGPIGEFEYLNVGEYSIKGKTSCAKQINMVAGGSGITPFIHLAVHIIRHPEDPTQMSMIYACRYESDLLLRSVLDQWAELFPTRFRVRYILSDSWPSNWQHSTGFVDAALFIEHLFPPDDNTVNLICGPPVFVESGCIPALAILGHSKEKIYSF
jgi:NAD(P)H-flavin reductase